LAAIALLTGLGLPTFNDVIVLTVETAHGNEYHQDLLVKKVSACHTLGQKSTSETLPLTLHDIALFPTKTLSQLAFDDTVSHIRQIGDRWASLLSTAKVSTLHDLEQGKRLEVEETLGYAVQQGAVLGIPTPTMDVCYKLIAGMNHYLQ
jgi:ketopantoate reductase